MGETSRKPSDDESNAVDQPPGARETVARGRRWKQTRRRYRWGADGRSRLESEREGCFRAGRYSRKSRESEPSGAKIRADEDISSREGI